METLGQNSSGGGGGNGFPKFETTQRNQDLYSDNYNLNRFNNSFANNGYYDQFFNNPYREEYNHVKDMTIT